MSPLWYSRSAIFMVFSAEMRSFLAASFCMVTVVRGNGLYFRFSLDVSATTLAVGARTHCSYSTVHASLSNRCPLFHRKFASQASPGAAAPSR